MIKKIFYILCILIIPFKLKSDQIIQDINGNYFLMKDDGSFKKLPPPKPGHRYVIKRYEGSKKDDVNPKGLKSFFKKNNKKKKY